MARWTGEVTLKVKLDIDTEEHLDDFDDADPDKEQDVREWINDQLSQDCTHFGDPEVEKVELKKAE